MLMVTCNSCHEMAFTDSGLHPDNALVCGCCTEKHDHGKAANETGEACRPVTITVLPGTNIQANF